MPTLSKITIFDLECTCDNKQFNYITPEIIQIGICTFNSSTKEISNPQSFFCRSSTHLTIYCTKLTGITDDQVKSAPPLNEALNTIKKQYPLRSQPWAAWGESDRQQLLTECQRKGIEYPLFDSYINISLLFSLFTGNKKRINLLDALKICKLEPIGSWHDAKDDAVNTARVFKWLIENQK